ncbi:unnamed protein product [Discosporangium mesarthrocarpum]
MICMSQAALSLLKCRHYCSIHKPSHLPGVQTRPDTHSPLPTPFAPGAEAIALVGKPSVASARGPLEMGQCVSGCLPTTVSVKVEGTLVDKVLCVAFCSLRFGAAVEAPTVEAEAAANRRPGRGTLNAAEGRAEPGAAVSSGNRGELGGGDATCRPGCHSEPKPFSDPHPTSSELLSPCQVEWVCSELLKGAEVALSAARLKWGHVAHLRVYHRQAPCPKLCVGRGCPGEGGEATAGLPAMAGVRGMPGGRQTSWVGAGEDLRVAMLLALRGRTKERPGVTVVPAVDLLEGVELCVKISAWDLPCLETELWVHGEA